MGVAFGVAVGVAVGVTVGVAVGVTVGVTVAVGMGVGVPPHGPRRSYSTGNESIPFMTMTCALAGRSVSET